MSFDFFIPTQTPLSSSILVSETKNVLQELLQVPQDFTLQVQSIHNGATSTILPNFLLPESPALCFFLDGHERIETASQLYILDMQEETFAVASMTGGGGVTYPRYAMTLACAIAAARQAASHVEGALWERFHTEQPQEIIDAVKCRHYHTNIEDALKEVAERISGHPVNVD